MSRPFGATNQPSTCLWCGRKLSMAGSTKKERTDKTRPPATCWNCDSAGFVKCVRDDGVWYTCKNCQDESSGRPVYRVVSRTLYFDKPGPRGDGFFCTVECAYSFARGAATNGYRFSPRET